MIRAQIEKKTGEQIAALDARFLDGKARALLREGEREIAAARKALTDGLPARVAAIAAEMGIPDCECRKRHAERMQLRLGSLQQMQAQLSDLIRTQYLDTADQLLRELRIFSGANALGRVIIRSQTKPWGYSLSRQPHHGGSQVNRPQEVAGGLVVTRGNAPVLLQAREEVLYQMPRLVQIAVIFALLLVRGPRGNHNGLALGQ